LKNFKQILASQNTETRPWALWIWNLSIDRQVMTDQLKALLAQGFGGILIRPGREMVPQYLSEEFFDLFAIVIETARKHGVGIRIADDFSLPWSGFFSASMNQSEKLRARCLKLAETTVCHEGDNFEYCAENAADTVILAARVKNQLVSLTDVRSLPISSDKPLVWKTPHGEWRVFVFLKEFVRDLAGGYIPNVYNTRSAQLYIQNVANVFRNRFAKYSGTTFKGFLTEMPAYGPGNGSIPWDDDLVVKFRTKYKKNLLTYLPSLFHDAPQAARIRNQVYSYLNQSMYERFCLPLEQWARKSRLSQWVLCPEHTIHQTSSPLIDGDFRTDKGLSNVGLQNLDGIEESFPLLRAMVDCNAAEYKRGTIAVVGRNRSGSGATLQSLKNEIDLNLMAGATQIIIDGCFFSLDQRSHLKTPHNPVWFAPLGGYFKELCSYTSRMQEVVRHAVLSRPVAVFSPAAAIRATYLPHNGETVKTGIQALQKTVNAIVRQNLDFDVLSEEYCVSCAVKPGGEFGKTDKKGKGAYSALVVPYAPLVSRSFLVFLEKLVSKRGTVLFLNETPKGTFEDGISSGVTKRIERLVNSKKSGSRIVTVEELETAAGTLPSRIRIRSNDENVPDLISTSAVEPGHSIYCVHNRSDRQEYSVSVEVPAEKHLYAIDCAAGTVVEIAHVVREAGVCRFNLFLQPQSTVVIAGGSAAQTTLPAKLPKTAVSAVTIPARNYRVILKNQWTFEALSHNALPLSNWNLRIGLSRESGGFSHFYESSFQVGTLPEECFFAMGGATGEYAKMMGADSQIEISVNGTRIDRPIVSATSSAATNDPAKQALDAISYIVSEDKTDARGFFGTPVTLYDIKSLLVRGFNRIALRSSGLVIDPQAIHYPPLMLGNFSIVRGQNGWVMEKNSATVNSDSWTKYGYPYLSGTGVYRQLFEVPHQYNRLILRLSQVSGIADISINNKPVSKFLWQPMEIDITSFCESKRNELAVTATNTIDNILRLNGRASGILGDIYLDVT
jgi:hypothetical protein